MNLDVSQISEFDGLTINHVYGEGEPGLRGEDSRIVDTPALAVHATREGSRVRVIGTLNATVEIDCDRCLRLITVPVAQSFDLVYIPPLNANDERELGDHDLAVAFYQGQLIDLDDLVREQIELALPMGRVCDEACKGLCPQCGTNLNEGKCDCAVHQTDLRWAALKEVTSNKLRD